MAAGLADLRQRPDPRQRQPAAADFAAFSNQDDPKRRALGKAAFGHLAVAWLEDVERQRDSGAEDRMEREERDLHMPGQSTREAFPAWAGSMAAKREAAGGRAGGFGGERRRPLLAVRWSRRQWAQLRALPEPAAVRDGD